MGSISPGNVRTQAQREREKREALHMAMSNWQKHEDAWLGRQAWRAEKKRLRRIREEERYEKWAAEREARLCRPVGEDELTLTLTTDVRRQAWSPAPQTHTPKRRMSIWQKRFIR